MTTSTVVSAAPVPAPEMRHSRFAVAGFVLAILAALVLCLSLSMSVVYNVSNPAADASQMALKNSLIGLALIGGVLLDLAAGALSIAGLVQRGRRRSLAAVGLVFSVLPLLCFLGFFVLGLMQQSRR